jgi:predicted transcriptional regulator
MKPQRDRGPKHSAGSLEAEVMAALWASDSQLTPGEVQSMLGRELAYTTVMTTLARLHAKGMTERVKLGRAYGYSPVQRWDEHAAQAMTKVLSGGGDKAAVLTHFVESLAPQDEALLRSLLDRGEERRGWQ